MVTNRAAGPRTLVDFLEDGANRFDDRPALLFKTGLRYRRWSYRDLWLDSGRLAAVLRERGVTKGDRVIIWGPNCPQWVVALFGCLRIGAVAVPLDIRSSPEFVNGVTERIRPRLMFVSRVTPSFHGELEIPEIDFEEMEALWEGLEPPDPVEVHPDDLVEVMFTSGTTGDPKGVMLSHRNLLSNLESIKHHVPGEPSYRLVSILPLSHMFEQIGGLLMPLSIGANVTYPLSLKPASLLKTLAERKATLLLLVPQVLDLFLKGVEREVSRQGKERAWRLLMKVGRFAPVRLRRILFRSVHRKFGGRLKHVFAGGAALDPELGAKWKTMGFDVIQGYGATEASPVISCHTIQNPRYDSAGPPLPGVEVKIAPDGEIMVRGQNLTHGYWEAPEQTAKVIVNGWYHTGDQGYLDDDGFLHINGRKKDMIVLANGQNVFPEDIEAVLQRHPSVESAVVIGLPRGGGTEVHAVLTADGETSAREAVAWANGLLADHQQVQGLTIWPEEDFPRTHTLKVKKGLVLEAVMAGPSNNAAPERGASPSTEERGLYQLVAEVAEVDPATVTADDALGAGLNLDSLGRVELMSLIEQELGVYLDETAVSAGTTVGEIEKLVEARLQESSKTSAPTFPQWPLTAWGTALRGVVQMGLAFPVFTALHGTRVSGMEHLRGLKEPAVFAINHNVTRWDTFLILKALPRSMRLRLAYAAAAETIFGRAWRGLLACLFVNAFPLYRATAVRTSLEHMGRLLDDGWSIGIFPEGVQKLGREMLPFQTGTGLLGVECGAPVVPMRITRVGRPFPIPWRETLCLRIGEPLRFPATATYAEATSAIENAVRSL